MRLSQIGRWLYRRAENVLALMLGVMFFAFLIQVVFRYFLNYPTGWTSELTVIMWLWMVLWGAAFVAREEEEIRFDLLHGAVRLRQDLVERLLQPRLQRVFRRDDAPLQPLALRHVFRASLRLTQFRQLGLEVGRALTHDPAQLLRLLLELLLRQFGEAVSPGIDLVYQRREFFRFPLVTVTQDLVENRLDHLTSVQFLMECVRTPASRLIRRTMRGTLVIPVPPPCVQR